MKGSACWIPNPERLENPEDLCPFNCGSVMVPDSMGVLCSRWGSGTPLVFKSPCTNKDLEECPLTEYPNEPNITFWMKWLEEREKDSS